MRISEIKPFVRFAAQIVIPDMKQFSLAPDNRLFYILDGDGQFETANSSHKIARGSAIYIPRGLPYKFNVLTLVSAIAINYDYSWTNSHLLQPLSPCPATGPVCNNTLIFEDCDALNTTAVITDSGKLINSFNRVLNETNRKLPFFREHLSGDVQVLIINLARAIYKSENHSQREEKLERVLDYIRDNYKNDISNQTLAEIAGYHPYHLNRIFKEYTGVSIHRYLNEVRISAAEQLLISTDLSVTEIATQSGFNSSTSFAENFKAKNDTTPLKFRNNYRKMI